MRVQGAARVTSSLTPMLDEIGRSMTTQSPRYRSARRRTLIGSHPMSMPRVPNCPVPVPEPHPARTSGDAYRGGGVYGDTDHDGGLNFWISMEVLRTSGRPQTCLARVAARVHLDESLKSYFECQAVRRRSLSRRLWSRSGTRGATVASRRHGSRGGWTAGSRWQRLCLRPHVRGRSRDEHVDGRSCP